MAGLVPAIHVLNDKTVKTWMPGTRPGIMEARQNGWQDRRHFRAARKRRGGRSAGHGPKIEYLDHQATAGDILKFFPGMKKEDLSDGQGWGIEWIRLTTHCTTHWTRPGISLQRWITASVPSRLMRSRSIRVSSRAETRLPAFCRWLCREPQRMSKPNSSALGARFHRLRSSS